MDKRGIELTINLVIVLVLALIALIIVSIIFSGGATKFADKIKGLINEIWAGKPDLKKGECVKKEGSQAVVYCGSLSKEECERHSECTWT